MSKIQEQDQKSETFDQIKSSLLKLDPVAFCEQYLTLDGKPFRLNGNGLKPFSSIYRYLGVRSLEPNSKPTILVKGRQIGGTTLAAALELYLMTCGFFGKDGRPPIRIIHAFPQREHFERYAKEKLNPMINLAVSSAVKDNKGNFKSYIQNMLDDTSDTNNSLHFKQFIGGNFIRIDSTGLNGDRLRGGSADVIFYDEVQDITGEAIGNTVEMLKQAKYGRQPGGVQMYFGTPKKKGSDFHRMWNASSQQYYYLGCEKCQQHFPFYTMESNEWEKIWVREFIVRCPLCQHEQDKRQAAERGKWVATRDINDPDVKMVGFHLNQLYMPHISREAIEEEKPGVHPTNTERKFKNEVLGEFFHGDASPVTIEEIIEKCGDRERKLRARITPGEEQMVVMGIDYGAKADLEQLANPDRYAKKGGHSYTTAVIMSVKGPNLFSVDFALKFARNDPESKRGIIDNIMRQYSVDLCIGDIGFSNDFSTTLHIAYGDKYLVSRVHAKVNDKIKFSRDTMPKEIVFEKDFYINEMLELLKKGQVKFPLGDYDRIAWLLSHCTSMELKPSVSRSGDPTIHYVKGDSQNDGLMALINAYIAYKFLITKGFTEKNPILQQQNISQKKKPLALVGYIPRRI